ncbi:DUF1330 domain-containing protein [Thalassotalea sp. M1531]|uniref:DUF1330 domain-containing protein n=1 Tax=Thalassotalea algicola TaxID=2716224 RepID=A0A7Y0Q4M8_9GAMM|nr:DUF1330 domain-containing protein [Thalassotalea algicola]NMP30139.1 DUF1330 domain-containing protein [Thalassotalea algicola]
MSAYLLIRATITDPENFARYSAVVPGLVSKFGGQYIVMDREPEQIEGTLGCQSIVMSKWPDKAAAQKFWDSEEYRTAIPLREGTGEFDVTLLNGL